MNPADYKTGGRRRSRGLKTKTLRRMCKSKGLKTTGKKATLMKRLHMRGGVGSDDVATGTSKVDAALDAPAEFEDDSSSGSSGAAASGEGAAAPAAAAAAVQDEGGKRRRRRSRRREGGGKRCQSRRKITEVALGH